MAVPHGIVVLNKPAGITSRDAVDVACKALKTREIGHCGTLDPLATGVLVLVVGRARRLQELLARSRKVYVGWVRLGATSETDDAEGPLTPTLPEPAAAPEATLRAALEKFHGEIEQRPPRYSAVKVDGERLYDLARRGQGVDAPMRKVKIYEIELQRYAWPDVEIRVACAGGTYVRSIARDLGVALGAGGYLAELCRTESGGFQLAQKEARNIAAKDRESRIPLRCSFAEHEFIRQMRVSLLQISPTNLRKSSFSQRCDFSLRRTTRIDTMFRRLP